MRIEFNIKKRHMIASLFGMTLLGVLVMVIAQTGNVPNPGHTASQVWIEGYGGINVENWVIAANNLFISHMGLITGLGQRIDNNDNAIINLQSGTWTGLAQTTSSPYYSSSFGGGSSTHLIPSSINANEVLVYVRFTNPQFGGGDVLVYTQTLITKNIQKIAVTPSNSDNIWLPVRPDRNIYVLAPANLNPGAGTIEIIGYR